MKIAIEVTPKKVFSFLGWAVVGLVLLGTLWIFGFLMTASGDSGAGYVLMGIQMVVMQHLYFLLVLTLVVGIGVARDTKVGKSLSFSIFKWLLVGAAASIILFGIAFMFMLR